MPVFQIATEANDGGAYRQWGESSSTGNTGGIGLAATVYADGNILWSWTPITGQASYRMEIRETATGNAAWLPGCGGIQPSTNNQISNGEPLFGNTNGPFTLSVTFYDGPSCTGSVVGSGTCFGFSWPSGTGIDNTGKILIGDQSASGSAFWNASGWMRFTNVNIPQGANVLTGQLRVQAVSKAGIPSGSLDIGIRAEDIDDATTNPSSFSDFHARTRTTAEYTTTLTAWDPGVNYIFPITSVIQEIIDRPGWVSGNDILIFFEDEDTTHQANTWISIQDFPSLSAAQLTIDYGISGVGSSAGTSTATATTLFGVRGDAAGQSVADGFTAFTQASTGTSAGTSTATAVGLTSVQSTGSSAGVATVTAVGLQGSDSVGSSAGTSTATATSNTGQNSTGSSAGTSTATAVGLQSNQTIGSSAGSATANGVGASQAESVGSSAGSATTSGVGESQGEADGSSAGVATVTAVGLQGYDSVGSSAGSATANGVGESSAVAVGSSAGSSTANAVREVLAEAVGSSAGAATVLAGGSKGVFIVGVSAGFAKMQGRVLSNQLVWLQDLSERRAVSSAAGDAVRFLELNGAVIIEPTAFEPDPATHRESHYYNAVTNTLYRKVTTRSEPGIVVAHWQKVSD